MNETETTVARRARRRCRARRRARIVPLVALVAITAGCGSEPAQPADEARGAAALTVSTAVAELTEVPVSVHGTGAVEPWRRVSPGTKILGRIDRFLVQEGQAVRRGDLLVELDQRDLNAAVEQVRAGVAMAEAQLENARAQHRRMESLHERGSVTDKNLEDAVSGLRVAEAAVEQARAALEAARVTLEYARIEAPIGGWVVAKHAEAGDMAAPGMPLLTLEDLSTVKVSVRVPESDVVGLTVGDTAQVRIGVLGLTLEAKVARIVPAADRGSRTFEVNVVIDNPGEVKSGMFARIAFPRGTRPALVVPPGAIVHRGQLDGLFVIGGAGRAGLRWVQLGEARAEGVEVLAGLEPGERYVIAPPPALVDGAPVREEAP